MMADRIRRAPQREGRASKHDDPCALHVEVEGSGPALILGHGFGGSARNFRPQARALRAGHRVILFDARGHARSEAPQDADAYTPGCFVADLAHILDDLGERRATVGGLSMGAGVALRFALTHPERVRGLVLAAFPPGSAGRAQGDWARGFADAIERDGLDAAGERYAWGPLAGFDVEAARLVRLGFLEHSPQGLVHTLRGLIAVEPSPTELAPQLRSLRLPTLVIVGAEDRLSRRTCEALAEILPEAELVVVEGAAHVVNLDAPEAFNRALSDFLAALPTYTERRS
jgi:pimeloyl-ACP methyl ester carboxylesterase